MGKLKIVMISDTHSKKYCNGHTMKEIYGYYLKRKIEEEKTINKFKTVLEMANFINK